MNANNSVRQALVAACLCLLPAPCVGQDPQPEDWDKHVSKACTSRRYGIRLAAARKVAAGGDAAVAAIENYTDAHGLNALPVSLVDAIADGAQAGPKVSRMLWSWTMNPEFFWRASAMRGMALRIHTYKNADEPTFDHSQVAYLMEVRAEHDPAWLMRTHARLGLVLDGKPIADTFAMPESDPRANVRLATLLLGQGKVPPMQPLIDALADERTFLGTPWGRNLANESSKALRQWLGDDFPQLDADDKLASIRAQLEVVANKTGQSLTMPKVRSDQVADATGGIEMLSCKHGDQFVQWTDDGTIYFGIDASDKVSLPKDVWQQLAKDRIAMEQNAGVVVCDNVRVYERANKTNVKVAPASMPAQAAAWLQRLAMGLAAAEHAEKSTDLLRGLGQFEMR